MRPHLAVVFLAVLACGGPEAPHSEPMQVDAGLERLPLGPRELPALARESAMAPSGRLLAVATRTHEVCVVDLDRGEVVLRASTGATAATSVVWSRDDAHLSTLGEDGEVRVTNSRSGHLLASFFAKGRDGSAWGTRRGHAFVAAGERIVVAAGKQPGELWDWKRPRMVGLLNDRAQPEATSFGVSRSGRLVAIGDARGGVRVWDAVAGNLRDGPWTVPGAVRLPGLLAFDFAPDDSVLAAGCGDAVVRLRSLDGSQAVREFGESRAPFLPDSIGCVRFSDDGTRLVATMLPVWDKYLWDVASGRQLSAVLSGAGSDARIAAWFSRDGERLVFDDDSQVRDVHGLVHLRSLGDQSRPFAFRSDGEYAWNVTSGMLRVFRVLDGATVLELPIRTEFGTTRGARGT